ncbi:hypothetical protein L1987_33582 [Smallanthus sonchifolius]|uniref:Uncharacterized protein n=1 Tax=Smallanthus sonchifolius TaxID=185202 RepID=A0ACB9HSW1_9ASTR|nr:hypothetical protein L1987_33582 [Smallanthus sonchifolius]
MLIPVLGRHILQGVDFAFLSTFHEDFPSITSQATVQVNPTTSTPQGPSSACPSCSTTGLTNSAPYDTGPSNSSSPSDSQFNSGPNSGSAGPTEDSSTGPSNSDSTSGSSDSQDHSASPVHTMHNADPALNFSIIYSQQLHQNLHLFSLKVIEDSQDNPQ